MKVMWLSLKKKEKKRKKRPRATQPVKHTRDSRRKEFPHGPPLSTNVSKNDKLTPVWHLVSRTCMRRCHCYTTDACFLAVKCRGVAGQQITVWTDVRRDGPTTAPRTTYCWAEQFWIGVQGDAWIAWLKRTWTERHTARWQEHQPFIATYKEGGFKLHMKVTQTSVRAPCWTIKTLRLCKAKWNVL